MQAQTGHRGRHSNGKVTTMGPLAGYRIIEMAGIGPAPFAAMLLADMGAEVIRVDRRESADLGLPGREPKFDVLHRGRRSLAVDVKSEAGRQVVRPEQIRRGEIATNVASAGRLTL